MFTHKKRIAYRRKFEKGKLIIGAEAVKVFAANIQGARNSPERGGILLGRKLKDKEDYVFDQVSEPAPGDKAGASFFKRQSEHHQSLVNGAWAESQGACNYLGEWHTHYENTPSPSSIDIKSWKKLMKGVRAPFPFIFFVIVGARALCVYEGNFRTEKLRKLNEHSQKDWIDWLFE